MLWSKYNFIFRSDEFGGLLFNALSNTYLAIPDAVYGSLAQLQAGDEYQCDDLGVFIQLFAAKALVEPGEDAKMRNVFRMQRRANDFSSRGLHLSIAPTLGCNCACPYCFEKNISPISMSEETEDAVVRFAERFAPGHEINIGWFGGEPLLRFEQMCRLTEKLRKLNFEKYSSSIVTNGTLLSGNVIARLDELAIQNIQITIDGPREIHDARRKLASGGGTFDTIIQNLDALMASAWSGTLSLRVNVDKKNRGAYHELYHFLREHYSSERLTIYAGFTDYAITDVNPDINCEMNREETADFIWQEANENGNAPLPLYPQTAVGGCMALQKNSFGVGPEGEIYKCLQDFGRADWIVGSVYTDKPWNNMLLAQYMEEVNPLNDSKCLDCNLFPVCDGGCPRKRLNGMKDYCSYFKDNLTKLLEAEYRMRQAKKDATAPKCQSES